MATLQYVGARYVPKLFDDGQGGMEWQANTYYEPLTIVTYNNSSYTSRGPVAASVGNPAENGEYWALTGNFNGVIASFSSRLESLESQFGIKTETRGIIVGDSYIATVPQSKNPLIKMADMLKIQLDHLYRVGKGGGGLSLVGGNGIISIWNNANIPDSVKKNADFIYLAFGYNDALNYTKNSPDTMDSQISAFMAMISAQCPKAKVFAAYINGGYASLTYEKCCRAIGMYGEILPKYGIEYVGEIGNILKSRRALLSDGIHPNPYGADLIGQVMAQSLTGSTHYGVVGSTSGNGNFSIIDNSILFAPRRVLRSASGNSTMDGNTAAATITFDSGFRPENAYLGNAIAGMVVRDTSNEYYMCTGNVQIFTNKLILFPYLVLNNAYFTGAFTYVEIVGLNAHLPLSPAFTVS